MRSIIVILFQTKRRLRAYRILGPRGAHRLHHFNHPTLLDVVGALKFAWAHSLVLSAIFLADLFTVSFV